MSPRAPQTALRNFIRYSNHLRTVSRPPAIQITSKPLKPKTIYSSGYVHPTTKSTSTTHRCYSQTTTLTMSTPQLKVEEFIASNKVAVFSKSYCPYCDKTKATLKEFGVEFAAMELDTLDDGPEIQEALVELTGQRSVPNTFIGGKHLGGNDDLQAKKESGELLTFFEQAGVEVKEQ